MFKAAIFDMDGLMIDSERLTLDVYKIYMATLGLSITKEFYVTMTGRTLRDCKKLLKDEYGQDFDSDLCIEKVYSMCADKIKEEGVALKKGLIELLTYLKENNCKTILASSSNRDKVDLIINKMKLTDYLDDSICGDEVNIGKPNPEIFLKVCKKLGATPEEAVVFEDSEAGIDAAYNGNIPVICVPDMLQPSQAHKDKAEVVLEDLSQAIDYIENM